jgi:hypothetical protein
MKRYETFLTSFSARINAIYLRLAGDPIMPSTSDESDTVTRSISSRFSASIPPSSLTLEVTIFNGFHRFLHRLASSFFLSETCSIEVMLCSVLMSLFQQA